MIPDDQAERILQAALVLAEVVRDEGPDAVKAAAAAVLRAAGGDAIAALAGAAVLIDVDRPVLRWWWEPTPPRPALKPCGTHAAAVRHYAHKEPLDDACKQAERLYYAEYRAEQRRQQRGTAA